MCDSNIGIDTAIRELTSIDLFTQSNKFIKQADGTISLLIDPSDTTSITTNSVTTASSVPKFKTLADSISEYVEIKTVALITLAIQGSSLPLSLLSSEVKLIISHAIQELSSSSNTIKIIKNKENSLNLLENLDGDSDPLSSGPIAEDLPSESEDQSTTESTMKNAGCEDQSTIEHQRLDSTLQSVVFQAEWESKVRAGLERLTDIIVLGEKIKSLALREPYGCRGKSVLLYEDCDPNSIWRWEALR